MQRLALTVSQRQETGKGPARRLRRAGQIPGVLYGHGTSLPVSVSLKEINRILHTAGGEHALLDVTVEDGDTRKSTKKSSKPPATRMALLKAIQVDPVHGHLLHVDLQEVAMDEKVRLTVPVALVGGDPVGVKQGGMLQHGVREVEIECLPHQIPDALEVDVSGLRIGDAVHVRDLKLAEGIRILDDPAEVLASVVPPISEAKLEEILTTPAEEAAAQPEVVPRGKEAAGEGKERPQD